MEIDLRAFCEVDKYAIESYKAIHNVGDEKNLGDITKVDLDNLINDVELLTHGSPCFPAGAKVLTNKGYKNIEDIEVGDYVLTHENRYRKVYELHKTKSKDIYTIKVQGSHNILVTGNHPFYVREKYTEYSRKSENYNRVQYKEPTWVELQHLNKNYMVGVAINTENKYPEWKGVEDNRHNQTEPISEIAKLFEKEPFWYFVGRYIGDGWVTEGYSVAERKPTYRTTLCCGFHEIEELERKLEGLFNYTKIKDTTTYKLQFSNKELTLFLKQFGQGASNKRLTQSILDLPVQELKALLHGYLDSDGSIVEDTQLKRITTVSEELALGVGHVIAKAYKKPFSIYKEIRPDTHIIEGRVVNQKDTYMVTYKIREGVQTHGFYEKGYIWLPIRKIEKIESEEVNVYNMEVEEDHTYTVNNIIVHNCQDFSQAGANKGGDAESGTRSSLIWNSVEIIRRSTPKIVIWENVKNVLSPKHIKNFEKYIAELDEIGYNSYYKVLNAKDYGDVQNRERIFIVSILKDIDTGKFKFPEEQPLERHLKEIMEEDVEDKWYLTEKQIERILHSTFNQNRRRIQEKEYCDTLCARDFKDPKCINTDKGVRKLTPREYWRIMGFSDADFDKAQGTGNSNSQLYKQAGNSIALGVITEIMRELREAQPNEIKDGMEVVSLFSGVGSFEMGLEQL